MSQTSREDLQAWLIERVADHVHGTPEEIRPDIPMSAYGLDSVSAVSLLVEIENRLGLELDANTLWDFPTVEALTDKLGELLAGEAAR